MRESNPLNFWLELSREQIPAHSRIRKFGRNAAVGTTPVPVTTSGVYQTPSSTKSLEILSSSAEDGPGGDGLLTARLFFTNGSWADDQEDVILNGQTPVALSGSYFRFWRHRGLTSGSYATQSTPSQAGTITIRESGGGATWAQIGTIVSGFGITSSQIGAYTVEDGYTAVVFPNFTSVDSTKTAFLYWFVRDNPDDTTGPPYSGILRVDDEIDGEVGYNPAPENLVYGPYVGPCDFGYMASVSSTTASVSVCFTIVKYRTDHISHLL